MELVVHPQSDEHWSAAVARCGDALERELVEFTGQTQWERSKIDSAAERILDRIVEADADG